MVALHLLLYIGNHLCKSTLITKKFPSNKKKLIFGATERYSQSSFRICIKKPFAPSHRGSNVVTLMFEVQNRRLETTRNIKWSSQSNSFKHCIPSFFSSCAKSLPLPRSFPRLSFPTGNTLIHCLFEP